MSLRRPFRVFASELHFDLRRPLFWITLVLMLFLAWALTHGQVMLEPRAGRTAGGPQLWFTSEYVLAQFLTELPSILYVALLAVAAGMAIIRDEEAKVTELLRATPLRPGEYVWGKFLGVLLSFFLVLMACIATAALFNHGIPSADLAAHQGPFHWGAYLRPAMILLLPPALLVAGVSFALGAISRRAILVFLAPMVFILGTMGFFWSWHPPDMSPEANRFLMLLDPTGYRWLHETYFRVDRGLEFYNLAPLEYDGGFLVSRLVFCALGLAAVGWAAGKVGGRQRLEGRRRREEGTDPSPLERAAAPSGPALQDLKMTHAPARPWSGLGRMLRSEFRELIHSPGLYLFIPLFLVSVIGSTAVATGPFGISVLQTAGTLALTHARILTAFLVFLLLVYGVDTLERDRETGLAPISHSTRVATSMVLLAKGFALVGLVMVVERYRFGWGRSSRFGASSCSQPAWYGSLS